MSKTFVPEKFHEIIRPRAYDRWLYGPCVSSHDTKWKIMLKKMTRKTNFSPVIPQFLRPIGAFCLSEYIIFATHLYFCIISCTVFNTKGDGHPRFC